MSKKVIGALLAIVMVLSVFSLTALAAGVYDWENDEDAKHHKQTWGLSTVEGNKINVILSTTYEVGPISFKIKDIKSLDDVKLGAGYYQGSDVQFSKTTGQVLIMPPVANTALEGKKLNNAVVATFIYTPSEGKVPAIEKNPKLDTVDGMKGTLIASRLTSKYVAAADYLIGQDWEVTALDEAPAPVPPTEGADIAVKSDATSVVIDGTKKFGGKYDGALYGFDNEVGRYMDTTFITNAIEVTNGGSLEITKPGALYGTGTTIAVKNADGSVAKTYVLIIFGDANCDGMVNGMDVTVIKTADVKQLPEGSPARMAANCSNTPFGKVLHDVNGMDLTPVVSFTKNVGKATFQSTLAKTHYETESDYYA